MSAHSPPAFRGRSGERALLDRLPENGDRFVESMRYVRSYPTELPKLAERLPEIDFVWEETPGEYASIVTEWVERRSQ